MLKNLKLLRQERGLSQAELGKLIGHSQQSVANYETGANDPDLQTLIFLADYFNTSTDFILGRTTVRNCLSSLKNTQKTITKRQEKCITNLLREFPEFK